MKNWPYPDKKLTTDKSISDYIYGVFSNALGYLDISGYRTYIVFPGEEYFNSDSNSSFTINVRYPYKSIYLSMQPDTVENVKSQS